MDELIFGTTNQAKVLQVRGALSSAGVEVMGLPEEARGIKVIEDGRTVQENARKKALAYASALGCPVLSMDNGLFFDGLPAEEQPGTHVRRIGGSDGRPSDDELRIHYAGVVSRLGGRVNGHWEFALCYARPDGTCEETTILSPRVFVATPSPTTVPGYPLESIQIDPTTGKYISEMSQSDQDEFWQRAIGTPLAAFVRSISG